MAKLMAQPTRGGPASMPLRQQILRRRSALTLERSSWVSQWQEIVRFFSIWQGRFNRNDSRGDKSASSVLDNSPTRALRILASGLMSGATSPARPWFRLGAPDPDLNRFHSVRLWLDDVVVRMQRVFARSNTYGVLPNIYLEFAGFGTASSLLLAAPPSSGRVIHLYPVTIGQFCLAQNDEDIVDTMYRDFRMSAAQMARQFGYERMSLAAKNALDNGRPDAKFDVTHAIEPREMRDPWSASNLDMPFRSVYLEQGAPEGQILSEGGFRHFPVLTPRWSRCGDDVYGNGPGHEALPDNRQLQHEQLKKAIAIDKMVDPPVQAPHGMSADEVNMMPQGVSFVSQIGPQNGIRSIHDVNMRLDYMLADIADVRRRISESFFTDLFLMLASAGPDTRMTATEVAERHEEKLLMLGPVLEGMHNELLSPLIDLTFGHMVRANMIPPPPPELDGVELVPEFVSVLAQAQRAVAARSIDRYVGNLGAVAQFKPDVLDKFDADQWADDYADMLGVPPRLIVPTERVAEIREARNAALAAKEQAEMMGQNAKTARDLAAAPTDTENALTQATQALTGYGVPQ